MNNTIKTISFYNRVYALDPGRLNGANILRYVARVRSLNFTSKLSEHCKVRGFNNSTSQNAATEVKGADVWSKQWYKNKKIEIVKNGLPAIFEDRSKLKMNKTYLNNTYVACCILLSIFIMIIIGGVELSGLDAVQLVMLTVLSYLLYINFEFFFRLKKEEYKRVITNNMKLFFNSNLNNLIRKKYIFPWIISSAIIIIIITIIRCIFYIFCLYFGKINWEYIFLYIDNEPYLYIVIIVVVTQIVLITILLSKRSSNEIGYLLAYFLTLRIAFLLFLNIFFAYDINEIMFLINVYDILSRSDIIGKISTSLQPNALIAVLDGLRINWYNQLNNYLISKYKSIYFNRIIPFQYSILSESSCNKVSLVKPKLLGSGYYRSQFQPYTLPQVCVCPSFNVELIYNKIFSSPTLTIISDIDYINLIKKYYSDISLWDDESTVGSSWDGDTVIGSEINLDLNFCDNDGAEEACSKFKDIQLKDPQLNFSSEYFHENIIQSVFVNIGNDRATSLDLTSHNEDNSSIIVEDIDLNQVANFLDGNVNGGINESRQTLRYNLRSGEFSSRGDLGLYGQDNNTSINLQNESVGLVENESIVFEASDEGLEEIYGGDYPSPGLDGNNKSQDAKNKSQDGKNKSQDCTDDLQDSVQLVKQLVEAQSNSEHPNTQFSDNSSLFSDNSSLSSHNTAEFEDLWDSDLTIREFKNFFNSVANEKLFSTELHSKFIEDFSSIEGISSMVINNNMQKSSQDEMLDLSFEGLVSMSKIVISRLIEESRENNISDTTISSVENIVKKTYNGNWFLYTRDLWYRSKDRFHKSLGAKRFAHLSDSQKEDYTHEFYAQHKKLEIDLYKNRSSDEYLKGLSVRIKSLVNNILNLNPRTWTLREKSLAEKVKSLRSVIKGIQTKANKLIKTSNLNNNIKDILLKQVKEITTNMYNGINIGNQIDHAYLNELENKIKDLRAILVKKSQLICKDTLRVITQNQFKPGNFYPTTKQSLLIAEFHKSLRDEIIYILRARLYARIEVSKKHKLIENEKLVKSELNGELDFLIKNLYTMPSLQDVCLHLLQELIKLNNKYYYICNKKFVLSRNNYFIYTKLKEIIITFIKKV